MAYRLRERGAAAKAADAGEPPQLAAYGRDHATAPPHGRADSSRRVIPRPPRHLMASRSPAATASRPPPVAPVEPPSRSPPAGLGAAVARLALLDGYGAAARDWLVAERPGRLSLAVRCPAPHAAPARSAPLPSASRRCEAELAAACRSRRRARAPTRKCSPSRRPPRLSVPAAGRAVRARSRRVASRHGRQAARVSLSARASTCALRVPRARGDRRALRPVRLLAVGMARCAARSGAARAAAHRRSSGSSRGSCVLVQASPPPKPTSRGRQAVAPRGSPGADGARPPAVAAARPSSEAGQPSPRRRQARRRRCRGGRARRRCAAARRR